MIMKFKIIKKGKPGVVGGGEKKYYASPVYSGELDLDELTARIEKISTVSGADVRAVLYSMVDVISLELSEGKIVRMGDLGSLRLSFSSEGKKEEKEVNASCIKALNFIFTAGARLKKLMNDTKFEKKI
ncbi:DsbA family protein [Bergeyella cardium]|uniref:DNA-binding protein n=2 Tax=Bergeyella cardium TaxID=1585976 RepID=A0A6P1QVW8_9FLAO|nr:HU family DNA-binding protein [Bergeyella cardium]QHN66156.1 DNA-binding protein [Bergeyella cardium]WHE34585.1 DsbA family protein [Bergeyella cardium]WHF61239.1 DsbA family protein [Bergeyella cardium]